MGFFRKMSIQLNLLIANADFRTAVKPPYAVFFVENENNIFADGIIVYSEKEVSLYLYHSKDDTTTEKMVEDYLETKEISFEKENAWLTEDKLVETQYTINFNKSEVL